MDFLYRLFRANRIEGTKCFLYWLFRWLFVGISDRIERSDPLKRLIDVLFLNGFFKESNEKAHINTFSIGFLNGLINDIPAQSEKGNFKMIAGFDIGYGQVKAYFGANGKGGDGKHCFPRVIAEAQGPEWGKLNETETYAINGAHYVIGEDALSYTENILRRESRDFVLEETY